MIYELAFEHNGKPYYLAGKKEVRDDPGFDMWADITTNYTRIHEGTDKSGPVVAAGVIYIGKQQLIDLIPTIRATNTSSPAESLKVLAAFGRFFRCDWELTRSRNLQPRVRCQEKTRLPGPFHSRSEPRS